MTSRNRLGCPKKTEISGKGTKLAESCVLYTCSVVLWMLCFASAGGWCATYYIDYASGSDSNDGIATSSPWKHLPGMPACTGFCKSKIPQPGDRFILKGGVSWPNASLGVNWRWNGSAGKPIYIGVDKAWFAGSNWARPVWNGERAPVASNNVYFLSASYIVLDNIEFTGLVWTGAYEWNKNAYIVLQQNHDIELMNLYMHGWSHPGATQDTPVGVIGDTHYPNMNTNSSLHDSIIDGFDTDQISGTAVFGGPPVIYNCVIRNVSNGIIVNGAKAVYNNVIENIGRSFDATNHINGFESNCDDGLLFFNNIVRHTDRIKPGSLSAAGVHVWFAPGGGRTTYVFNNVLYDTPKGNVFAIGSAAVGCPGVSAGSIEIYNNTVECGPDSGPSLPCITGSGATSLIVRNNHFITSSSAIFPAGAIAGNNITQTLAAANSLGYNMANAFAPTSPSGITVNSGSPIVCPACTGVDRDIRGIVRPQAGAWDVGAYEYTSDIIAPKNLKITPLQ